MQKKATESRPSLSAYTRDVFGSLTKSVKPYRIFFPFPRLIHRILYEKKIRLLRLAVARHNPRWDGSVQLLILSIPKCASSTLLHHAVSAFPPPSSDGGLLVAKNMTQVLSAVEAGFSPRILAIGHQDPHFLVDCGLMGQRNYRDMTVIGTEREEHARIESALGYLRSIRYIPRLMSDPAVIRYLRIFGGPRLKGHDTGAAYGPQIHLAPASDWYTAMSKFQVQRLIPLSHLEDRLEEIFNEFGGANQLRRGLKANPRPNPTDVASTIIHSSPKSLVSRRAARG